MASLVLYPPIVDSSMPAFPVQPVSIADETLDGGSCEIFFSLSKFNVSSDVASVQVSIKKQSTGENVVKREDDDAETSPRLFRATGIILDVPVTQILGVDNLYKIELKSSNLRTVIENIDEEETAYRGWIPGTLYQVQIRLSGINYADEIQPIGQEAWLNANANMFSEWSTICIVKAISQPYIKSKSLTYVDGSSIINFDSSDYDPAQRYSIKSTNLLLEYCKSREDNEPLYSYRVSLYANTLPTPGQSQPTLLEKSDIIYVGQNEDYKQLNYVFKYNIQDEVNYGILIEYETKAEYTQSIGILITGDIDEGSGATPLDLYTVENNSQGYLVGSSESLEADEGRVLLLIYGTSVGASYYIISRSDSRTNYQIWEDIRFFGTTSGSVVNTIIPDYTIESGIFYKYRIQSLDGRVIETASRGVPKVTPNPIIREFDYCFLLGKNNKQLKLKFDNDMNNFSINVKYVIQETFDVFPNISRLGSMRYKSFPVTGLISFNMDENYLFATKEEIYGTTDSATIQAYESRETTRSNQPYNYYYERGFRNKVMEFLYSDEPKLFKSPTEGNVLIRLTNISLSPNESLGRLIYSFNSTATEIADNTVDKLKKYKIINEKSEEEITLSGETVHESHSPEVI